MNFRDIRIDDFTYDLPDNRIARYPLNNRDESKLLVWQEGEIEQNVFREIDSYIPENSLMVFNNTRVIHARMLFKKETGSVIEIFCLEPVNPIDYQISFGQTCTVTWKCLIGNAKKWKNGTLSKLVQIEGQPVVINAEVIFRNENTFHVRFTWDSNINFARVVEIAGTLPIPPYLGRETEDSDEETYQTLYASVDGSVAAPTAGLHFTDEVFTKIHQKKIITKEITLHVGAGTFQPVKSPDISGHIMHHEKVIISREFIVDLINSTGRIIAVGTTSVRSIESLYWLGLKLVSEFEEQNELEVSQWEPYNVHEIKPFIVVLKQIIRYLDKYEKEFIQFSTQIIILPGYRFRIIDGLITNFHQPQSTLLLLISAFIGNDWRRVYDYALKNDFRFLSYGDSNLYLKVK